MELYILILLLSAAAGGGVAFWRSYQLDRKISTFDSKKAELDELLKEFAEAREDGQPDLTEEPLSLNHRRFSLYRNMARRRRSSRERSVSYLTGIQTYRLNVEVIRLLEQNSLDALYMAVGGLDPRKVIEVEDQNNEEQKAYPVSQEVTEGLGFFDRDLSYGVS